MWPRTLLPQALVAALPGVPSVAFAFDGTVVGLLGVIAVAAVTAALSASPWPSPDDAVLDPPSRPSVARRRPIGWSRPHSIRRTLNRRGRPHFDDEAMAGSPRTQSETPIARRMRRTD